MKNLVRHLTMINVSYKAKKIFADVLALLWQIFEAWDSRIVFA